LPARSVARTVSSQRPAGTARRDGVLQLHAPPRTVARVTGGSAQGRAAGRRRAGSRNAQVVAGRAFLTGRVVGGSCCRLSSTRATPPASATRPPKRRTLITRRFFLVP